MRVFVTGASGWIGSAVVAELVEAGHEVVGLARSDAAAETVETLSAEVVRGELADIDVLARIAADCDGVVHLAFRHDVAFSGDFATAVDSDRAAIEALGKALGDSGRPLAVASGVAGLKPGVLATEADMGEAFPGAGGRILNERAVLALAERGVRSMSVRFAPTVHGDGDSGFVARIVAADRDAGTAAYIGDGRNRWPAVHRSDAARLVRLGLETAPAGSVLHAVGEEGVATYDMASAIGQRLGLPVGSIDIEQATDQFGFLAHFLALDMPVSSARTQELLGWTPTGPTLIADVEQGSYDAA